MQQLLERISCCYIWITRDGPTLGLGKRKEESMLFGNRQSLLTRQPRAMTTGYSPARRKKSLNVWGITPIFLVFFVCSFFSPLVDTKSELWVNVSCQNAARDRSDIATGPSEKISAALHWTLLTTDLGQENNYIS